MIVTLQIQKEFNSRELAKAIKELEKKGWTVDVQSEEEEE